MSKISDFLQQCQTRQDVSNSTVFREFMGGSQLDCEYIEEWNKAQVGSANMRIIDFAWDPAEMLIISLERQNNSVKKSSPSTI